MRRLALFAFCTGLATATFAQAQVQQPAAAEAEALSRRYIAALHMDQSLKPMMLSMTEVMVEQQAKRHPNLSDAQRKQLTGAINAAIQDVYDKGLFDKMADKMIPGMVAVFSVGELKALAEFYESPTGQSIVGKLPAFGQIGGKAVAELMPEMQKDLEARIVKNVEALKLND